MDEKIIFNQGEPMQMFDLYVDRVNAFAQFLKELTIAFDKGLYLPDEAIELRKKIENFMFDEKGNPFFYKEK